MKNTKKTYKNIRAYESVTAITILCTFGSFIVFCALSFFIYLTVEENILYLIGVVTTGIIGLWSLGMVIKQWISPKMVLEQQDEVLYLFPDTKEQIIITLKEIVEISKNNASVMHGAGRLTIVCNTACYTLKISSIDLIAKRLNENIKLFSDDTHLNLQ